MQSLCTFPTEHRLRKVLNSFSLDYIKINLLVLVAKHTHIQTTSLTHAHTPTHNKINGFTFRIYRKQSMKKFRIYRDRQAEAHIVAHMKSPQRSFSLKLLYTKVKNSLSKDKSNMDRFPNNRHSVGVECGCLFLCGRTIC